MNLKLSKTLLSDKLKTPSFFIGLLGLSLLLLFYGKSYDRFAANAHIVFQDQQYWRAFTSSLMHADLQHLGSNSVFFLILSVLLNNYFGWFVFPTVSLLMGGLINLITLHFYPPEVFLVGVSGVVYFMGAFWVTLYVLIERQHTLTRRLLNSTAIALIFFFPEVFDVKTSYLAHAVGFALGIPMGMVYFALTIKELDPKKCG